MKMSNSSFVTWMIGGGVTIVIALVLIGASGSMMGNGCSFMRCADLFVDDQAVADRLGVKMMGDYYNLDASTSSGSAGIAAPESMPYPYPTGGGQTAAEADQRIIKTAELALAVSGVDNKVQEAISLATGKGGFVQSSTVVEDDNGQKTGYVIVRVPVATFEDTISELKKLAVRVERESINGQDVTENYTDLEARLRSAKAQEDQYLQILDIATSVQDILSVQQYLQNIRYEIESLQGQLDSLGNQTEYSTISLTMYEETRIEIPTNRFDLRLTIKEAGRSVVLLAQAALTVLIWLIVVGGAFVLPLGLLAYAIVKLARYVRNRLM